MIRADLIPSETIAGLGVEVPECMSIFLQDQAPIMPYVPGARQAG